MSETAFVTGGSGFIGGHLIERLVSDRWHVRALARSEGSAAAVRAAGADPVAGELGDRASIEAGARGARVAFHAAAHLGEWGARAAFVRDNVEGTRNVVEAARRAGVERLVHVGTEAALLTGKPLINVDESAPLRPDSKAAYAATKAIAEQIVRAANGAGLETVVVRPRLVWGKGDTTILPSLLASIDRGRFTWIGGGGHLTSTTHVDNAVEGLLLAARAGRPGGVYFVTDGAPVVFRDFITELIATQGVEAPGLSIPKPLARVMAVAGEAIWNALRRGSAPPLTRLAYWLLALETTIDSSRAQRELGYRPIRTIEDGMAELRSAQREGSHT